MIEEMVTTEIEEDIECVRRWGLKAFTELAWQVIEPSTPFIGNWHLDVMAEHVEAVWKCEINDLLINMPPRHMKSIEIAVMFPAYVWTVEPSLKWLYSSYAQSLSIRDSVKMRRLVESPWYRARWGSVYDLTSDQNQKMKFENNKTGYRMATGVGGSNTGEGGDIIVCLPYNSLITTDQGLIPIGRIVEERLAVRVLSYDHAQGSSFQSIEAYEANDGAPAVRLTFSNGLTVEGTHEHPLYVEGIGYVPLSEVPLGSRVVAHRKTVRHLREVSASVPRAYGQDEHGVVQSQVSRAMATRPKQHAMARRQGVARLRAMWQAVQREAIHYSERASEILLQCLSLPGDPRFVAAQTQSDGSLFSMWDGPQDHQAHDWDAPVLLSPLRQPRTQGLYRREWQRALRAWSITRTLLGRLSGVGSTDTSERWTGVLSMPCDPEGNRQAIGCAPHRLRQDARQRGEPDYPLPNLSWGDARFSGQSEAMDAPIVVAIERIPTPPQVYNLRIARNHNYYANGILLHNCDDPHNVEQRESDVMREGAIDWWSNVMSTRINDPKKRRRIVVMQRVHEHDLSGHLLDQGGWHHLNLPAEYEGGKCIVTGCVFHWDKDPRTVEGEPLWKERYGKAEIAQLKKDLKEFGCTPAESPVLMADLSTKPISEIQAGDMVVGFTESDPVRRRTLRPSKVLNVMRYDDALVQRMYLSNGHTVRCTADHKWFTRRSERDNAHATYAPVKVGGSLCYVAHPFVEELKDANDARIAGWLAGFFDADGSASGRNGGVVAFYQGADRNLPLCNKLEEALRHFGFGWRINERLTPKGIPVRCYSLLGGLPAVQRFIHLVKPTKWRQRLIDATFANGARFVLERPKVIDIVEEGREPVYALETETGNYVVWGYASSNSAAQLQQRPAPAEGGILKRHWWRYWCYPGQEETLPPVRVKLPSGEYLEIKPVPLPYAFDKEVQSWDMAFKDLATSSYVVGEQWGRKGPDAYLTDQIRDQMDFTATLEAFRAFNRTHKRPSEKVVEDKANGPAIISVLKTEIPGIEPHGVQGDKQARAAAYAHLVKAGNCFLPHPSIAPWVEGFIAECATFPNSEFDDQVDTWSQAMDKMYKPDDPGVSITPEYSVQFHQAKQALEPVPGLPSFRFWFQGLYPCCIIGQILSSGRIVLLDCLLGEQNGGIEELIDRKVTPVLAADYRGCTDWRDITNHPPLSKLSDPSEHRLDQIIANKLEGAAEPGEPDFFTRLNAIKGLMAQTGRLTVNPAPTPGEPKPWIHEALSGGYAYRKDQSGVISKTEARKFHPLTSVGEALGHGLARIFVRKPMPSPKFNKLEATKRAKSYAV